MGLTKPTSSFITEVLQPKKPWNQQKTHGKKTPHIFSCVFFLPQKPSSGPLTLQKNPKISWEFSNLRFFFPTKPWDSWDSLTFGGFLGGLPLRQKKKTNQRETNHPSSRRFRRRRLLPRQISKLQSDSSSEDLGQSSQT